MNVNELKSSMAQQKLQTLCDLGYPVIDAYSYSQGVFIHVIAAERRFRVGGPTLSQALARAIQVAVAEAKEEGAT